MMTEKDERVGKYKSIKVPCESIVVGISKFPN